MESECTMTIVTAGAVAFILCILHILRGLARQRYDLPPGPKGTWLIGNVSDLFCDSSWKRLSALSKTFGDIMYMSAFGRPVIVVNKYEIAHELMVKQGAVYSGRPRMVYLVDVLGIRSATFMQYGDEWRAQRRLMHQYLNSRAVTSFHPHQTKCVNRLLEDLLDKPNVFWKHVRRSVASTILLGTYGYFVAGDDDPLLKLASQSDAAFVKLGPPGATPVDFFPALRHLLPLILSTSVKKILTEARTALDEMSSWPFEMVKEQRISGTAMPSLLSRMMDDYERQGIITDSGNQNIKDACGAMYRAGVGTTSAVLYVFILAMVLHPRVAKKAQSELDGHLKGERLPVPEDRSSLPYLTCVLNECLRWAPPFPLGIAHQAMEEGYVTGKRIPKGAMIVPNVWQMMHDEHNYVDPEIFNPDRFLESGKDASFILEPSEAVFGFGRRICPGRHFADSFLWLAMASILTVFDVLPAKANDGSEILPEVSFLPRLNSWSLEEFSCRFVPRSEKLREIVTGTSA